ncbi:MAG: DNA-directed RNA polymerase subunit omega [Clostridiales bacterium]|nr:DNA-directed RNA polymerase subunit omega [Clostridiales bacterium]MBR5975474.1 DNA-directed RNA polymerase subunit omega [Clostridiales bacterium]
MLVDPSVEELLPKAECRYSLCMLVAKRARQLVDGAQPMVDDPTPSNVTLACKEVAADKVVGVEGQHKPYVPLRPEIEEARRLAKEAAEKARLEAEGLLEPEAEGEQDGAADQAGDVVSDDSEDAVIEESGDEAEEQEAEEDASEEEES